MKFPSGMPPERPRPLDRFLPPLLDGSVASALAQVGAAGERLLDPFGASPRLEREAAESGHAILAAVNNPVNRFIMQFTLQPFRIDELRAALASLSSLRKDGGRLEPFLLDLYRTSCSRCGSEVSADYFVWDRELERPVLKGYACTQCQHSGEEPATLEDGELAASYARHGLQHSLALDTVTPPGDPYRSQAEAALAVYPGRALYALITIINKLNQLDLEGRELAAAQALVLSALDGANGLWSHGEGRQRPRQLMASAHFREANVWRGLERAVQVWASSERDISWREWSPGAWPDPGEVALFSGSIRELVAKLPRGEIDRVLTVVPRPNPAYWSLSALWSAWLWGREVARPIKASLGRRRYDWTWTANAFRTVLSELHSAISQETQVFSFVLEADPGFLPAVLAGFAGADLLLTEGAFREDVESAVLKWEVRSRDEMPKTPLDVPAAAAGAMSAVLRARGEPTPFGVLHAGAWMALIKKGKAVPSAGELEDRPLIGVGEQIMRALSDWTSFRRLDQNVEPERGLYWLVDTGSIAEPLADRVEMVVLGLLRGEGEVTFRQVDAVVCEALPGLLTPERRLVGACLVSYAVQDGDQDRWRLREQDRQQARARDAAEIPELLRAVGERLGFVVEERAELIWQEEDGEPAFRFLVQESARFGEIFERDGAADLTLVIPGGRAALVTEKARRDPRIRWWLEEGVRVLKYRHVRRLAEDPALKRENLMERLSLDPPESQDSQMPLL